jgi:hypothetical protein
MACHILPVLARERSSSHKKWSPLSVPYKETRLPFHSAMCLALDVLWLQVGEESSNEELQRALDAAVAREDYAEAARFRDIVR